MPLLEDNVLKLLHVPASLSKDTKGMSENSNLVQVSHLDLAESGITDIGRVDPVKFVNNAFTVEFLDHAHSFLTDSRFSLLGAGTAMVCAVDSWVRCDRVLELARLG